LRGCGRLLKTIGVNSYLISKFAASSGSRLARCALFQVPFIRRYGRMAEWFMALVLKTSDSEMGPGVRIPLLPVFTKRYRRVA